MKTMIARLYAVLLGLFLLGQSAWAQDTIAESDLDEEMEEMVQAADVDSMVAQDMAEFDEMREAGQQKVGVYKALKQKFIESGHSKIVVYHEDIDHIIGYIHSSEMFRSPKDWTKSLRTMTFVPETMAASKMMQTFLAQKKSLGVVVDEFGGTSGLVALEDIVEEIFGDIEDEHDSSNYVAKQLDNGEYLLSARLEIEKVNELFGLQLPESDDYMTVGGLILHAYQSFPKLNEVVAIGNFSFKIVKNTATKIELVRLKVGESTNFS
jgi:CBS domain containing-hemolysin-like protein